MASARKLGQDTSFGDQARSLRSVYETPCIRLPQQVEGRYRRNVVRNV